MSLPKNLEYVGISHYYEKILTLVFKSSYPIREEGKPNKEGHYFINKYFGNITEELLFRFMESSNKLQLLEEEILQWEIIDELQDK